MQLEIGVQSVNEKTISAIQRKMKFEKLKENVLFIKKHGNIHQHLDLIAGAPFENYESFAHSFNGSLCASRTASIRLLKVLKVLIYMTGSRSMASYSAKTAV